MRSFKERLIDTAQKHNCEERFRDLCRKVGVPSERLDGMSLEDVCEIISENYVLLYNDCQRNEIGFVEVSKFSYIADKIDTVRF